MTIPDANLMFELKRGTGHGAALITKNILKPAAGAA
jgi:hypothetical protein